MLRVGIAVGICEPMTVLTSLLGDPAPALFRL